MSNFVYRRQFPIEWGHCDPAGIVFNSRFFEFFDWSAWKMFEAALGVPPNELPAKYGIVGIPMVDIKARFLRPAKFNDMAEMTSEIGRFGRGSFEILHRLSIDGELAVEGAETRVWAQADPNDATRLRVLPIPAEVISRFQSA